MTAQHVVMAPPALRGNASRDAVIVIPGIMGTRLAETSTGRVLWGLGKAALMAARWRDGDLLGTLALTPAEREALADTAPRTDTARHRPGGPLGRIRPDGLLRTVEWAPLLRGFEPYGRLVSRLRRSVVHPDAVLEFGYDWRLPVTVNADLLAHAASGHLRRWRGHHALEPGPTPRLVLVAHSMGGLVAAAMCERHPETAADVRASVTLGTPFRGAVQAAVMLSAGEGLPLGRARLRTLARTLPGVHDLLPDYRCLERERHVVQPTIDDFRALGADPLLAARRCRIDPSVLPGHHLVTGYGQQTAQTMRLRDGIVVPQMYGFEHDADGELVRDAIGRPIPVDHTGDGTVFRYSAALPGVAETPLVQQHGALARTPSAADIACGVVMRREPGSALPGEAAVALRMPEQAAAGEPIDVLLENCPDAGLISCTIEDAETDTTIDQPIPKRRGDDPSGLSIRIRLSVPGLYRVNVWAGRDPVTQLVMVEP